MQVIELQEHACPILMYGPKLFFVVIFLSLFNATSKISSTSRSDSSAISLDGSDEFLKTLRIGNG